MERRGKKWAEDDTVDCTIGSQEISDETDESRDDSVCI